MQYVFSCSSQYCLHPDNCTDEDMKILVLQILWFSLQLQNWLENNMKILGLFVQSSATELYRCDMKILALQVI